MAEIIVRHESRWNVHSDHCVVSMNAETQDVLKRLISAPCILYCIVFDRTTRANRSATKGFSLRRVDPALHTFS
jgi:hypothetical protein